MRRIRNALLALALCLPAAALADLNTVFVSQDVPAIMVVGQSYPVNVTVQNSGSWGWNHLSGYALGSQNPQNNTTWGLNRVPLTYTVGLNEVVPFDFQVTAPATTGTYNFQWRMVSNNLGWYGATSPNVAVQVVAPDAQFISQFVPTVMNPGQTYSVSVTMKNIGSAAWAPGSYRLGSQNPADNTIWGLNRVELSSSVAPGANATFNFDILAPATPGPYNFQWRMALGTSHWFGASSSNVQVDVGTSAANMHFVHVDHLNTPRLVANGSGTTVWRWDQDEPFGNNVADEDPDGNSVVVEVPLRFPGQYADKEINLHYNYYRSYDSLVGRYLESDPIGLAGGIHTYAYVDSAPTSWSDALGLTKGGKRNLNTEGFTKKSDPQEVEKKMNQAKQKGQRARYNALKALLKVIKRGGTMGYVWGVCETYRECQIDPCSCDPYSVACLLSPGTI